MTLPLRIGGGGSARAKCTSCHLCALHPQDVIAQLLKQTDYYKCSRGERVGFCCTVILVRVYL
jgi:hypothetical protein